MSNTQTSKINSSYDACAAIEGFDGLEHSEEDIIEAFQFLIDCGDAWRLQGFYGRTAARLIDAGLCRPAKRDVN